MTLSSLLVSRDWSEVSVLECILGGLHIGVDVEPEPARARAKLARTKVDALIVDCDLAGSADFLHELNDGLNTVPLVIISSANGRNRFKDSDATFVFEKPISVEQAVHTLSAARNLILDGRLRYHRHTLDLPVYVTLASKKRVKASLMNLSQGGVAVRPCRPITLPRSSGCTRNSKIVACEPSTDLTLTSSGWSTRALAIDSTSSFMGHLYERDFHQLRA